MPSQKGIYAFFQTEVNNKWAVNGIYSQASFGKSLGLPVGNKMQLVD